MLVPPTGARNKRKASVKIQRNQTRHQTDYVLMKSGVRLAKIYITFPRIHEGKKLCGKLKAKVNFCAHFLQGTLRKKNMK